MMEDLFSVTSDLGMLEPLFHLQDIVDDSNMCSDAHMLQDTSDDFEAYARIFGRVILPRRFICDASNPLESFRPSDFR